MEVLWEILISALLVVAGVFGLVGSYGLAKLPDPMTRLHTPTKATTLGVGGALIASMLYFAVFKGELTLHELMITLFLLLTSPISAHFIAKANLFRDWTPDRLPRPEGDSTWAVYAGDSDTSAVELAGRGDGPAAAGQPDPGVRDLT